MRFAWLLMLSLLTGCANYRYEAALPQGPTRLIRDDADLVLPAEPAQLRLRQVESRCVVLIENNQPDPITLDGSGSAIVDADGQSHAIPTQPIPPGAYLKLVLPPLADQPPRGPRWNVGLGFGMVVDARPAVEPPAPPADPEQPRRAVRLFTTPSGVEYWEWDGPGRVKLILALTYHDQRSTHEVLIRREKK